MTRGQASLRSVAPFLTGLAIFLALALFNEARGFVLWRNYALSGFLLGAPTVYALWRFDVRIPAYIQSTILAALLLHYGGGSLGSPSRHEMGLLGMHGVNGAYHTFDWWDHLTHGVGIGASAMGIAYLLEVYQTRRGLHWSASGVWIVTVLAALAAGVGVELYEFLGKTAFQTIDQGGYENTMRDLHFNLVGAMAGGGIAVLVNRTRFRARIREQWGVVEERDRPADGWWRDLPPRMAGFLAFVTLPAFTSLFLASQFFTREIPPDDHALYDPALMVLTWSALAAVVAAPLVTWTYGAWRRRLGEAA